MAFLTPKNLNPKKIIGIILIAAIVTFALQNLEMLAQPYSVVFLNDAITFQAGVWFLFMYLAGFFTFMVFGIKGSLSKRSIIKDQQKEIKNLREELNQYRNQSLDEKELEPLPSES